MQAFSDNNYWLLFICGVIFTAFILTFSIACYAGIVFSLFLFIIMRFNKQKFDLKSMNKAAKLIIGEHDFSLLSL